LIGCFCGGIGRQGEEKKTALAQLAFHPHLAAQFVDDLVNDRKTQPVSWIVDMVDLAERREQARLGFLRQARGVEQFQREAGKYRIKYFCR